MSSPQALRGEGCHVQEGNRGRGLDVGVARVGDNVSLLLIVFRCALVSRIYSLRSRSRNRNRKCTDAQSREQR